MAKERILVVEDEHIVALDIKMHLERYGYEVPAMYPTGEEALVNLELINPVLVLMDIKLAGNLDGLDTAEEIRRRYNIPVILLTAYADESTIERAKVTEPFAYIIKPFEERELRTAIVIALYRHRMEQEILRRERLFSTTLNSISEAVIVTDNKDTVTFCNPAAAALLGFPGEECAYRTVPDLFRLESGPEEDVVTGERLEYLVRPDDSRVPVEKTVSPLLDESGEANGRIWVFRDVSARVEAARALRESQEQFRQAQKMEAIGRLSGGIAHDFNNLLTVILGYAKLMRSEVSRMEAPVRDNLLVEVEGVDKAARKSANLTRQLLAFSRRQILKPEPTDLNSVIGDLEKMLRRLLTEEVQLYLSLRANNSFCMVDQGQMEQVILNLAVNARDAMPAGGTLTIRTRTRHVESQQSVFTGHLGAGDYVAVEVEDTGSGMDRETMLKIFDPFFTTKEPGRGTGLGLSTVYGIVTQTDGCIDVKSAPGEGTTFMLYFPQLDMSESAESEREETRLDLRGTERVLVVEDDEQIRGLLCRVLRVHGYSVLEAGNAGEALLISEKRQDVDLVVTDIVMPHVTGEELAERLRAQHPGMRVLFMSGYPESFPDPQSQNSRTAFLQKPFEPEQFLVSVRQVLDEPVET